MVLGLLARIARIVADYGERAAVRLVAGGLRVGTSEPMDDAAKAAVHGHWEHVHAATGQPFDFAFFERQGFVYDTGPACRAAVAMRNLAPEQAFAYLQALQRGFYAENRDVTAAGVLTALAKPFCAGSQVFAAVYAAPEVEEATAADFRLTQALGIAGFPAVVLKDEAGLVPLTIGYQPFADLAPALEAWLSV
ncbi:MAG: DsbA family protein [Rhodospirillales bacterium]